MNMPYKNYYSIRVMDPKKCAKDIPYGTIGGPFKVAPTNWQIRRCIPHNDAYQITGSRPTKKQWNELGVTQSVLVPKSNVRICMERGRKTLCPKTAQGSRQLYRIRKGGIFDWKGGTIVESTAGDFKLVRGE